MSNHTEITTDKYRNSFIEAVISCNELMKVREGKYFIGYCEVSFEHGFGAWVRLYNPIHSGVDLYISRWTVMDLSQTPYLAEIWLNAIPSGSPVTVKSVTPTNMSVEPVPESRIRLQTASYVQGKPIGGVKALLRRGLPCTITAGQERGKYILSPGGSFTIYISQPEEVTVKASGSIILEWWEE